MVLISRGLILFFYFLTKGFHGFESFFQAWLSLCARNKGASVQPGLVVAQLGKGFDLQI
jgi:hypothetical protein